MEGSIQLIANYDDWKVIRKITITPQTDPLMVAEFLANLTKSVDSKVEFNLKKIVALEKIDAAVESCGLAKGDVAKAIDEVNSRKVNSVVKEVSQVPGLQKNRQSEVMDFCKAYAMRKALKACGVIVDYSEVEIPGMGRLKKTKVKE
ncbi:MAG: DUF2666 family protein [archaeon]